MEPGPVTDSEEPVKLPGPETTEKATGSPEEAEAERLIADPPKGTEAGGLKVIVWLALATLKDREAEAAPKLALPAWLACTVIEPAPVIVRVLPDTVAGPLVTV